MNNHSFSTSTVDDEFNLFEVPNLTGSPERRLLLAILERAILDYVGNDKREVEEAEAWIFGDLADPKYSEFSFSWLCQELDLDMPHIAKVIFDMPKRGSRKIAPWYFSKPTNDAEETTDQAAPASDDRRGIVTEGHFRQYH